MYSKKEKEKNTFVHKDRQKVSKIKRKKYKRKENVRTICRERKVKINKL